MKIAVAQLPIAAGNIETNIAGHLAAVVKAAEAGVDYLVFAELSLTGYEPELAEQLATSADDARFSPLSQAAVEHNINLVAGVPIKSEGLPFIGVLLFTAAGEIKTYRKMFLHDGEETFFQPGENYLLHRLNEFNIGNAICADTNHAEHVFGYAELGADIYLAGVMITEGGYTPDTDKLAGYAKEHNMLVGMANYNHISDGWVGCGQSGFWTAQGKLITASVDENVLVTAEYNKGQWSGGLVALA